MFLLPTLSETSENTLHIPFVFQKMDVPVCQETPVVILHARGERYVLS